MVPVVTGSQELTGPLSHIRPRRTDLNESWQDSSRGVFTIRIPRAPDDPGPYLYSGINLDDMLRLNYAPLFL